MVDIHKSDRFEDYPEGVAAINTAIERLEGGRGDVVAVHAISKMFDIPMPTSRFPGIEGVMTSAELEHKNTIEATIIEALDSAGYDGTFNSLGGYYLKIKSR